MSSSRQRLGEFLSSATGPTGWMGAYLSVWKPLQIINPASQIRNQIGDMFRMWQTGLIDGQTSSDMLTLWKAKDGMAALARRDFSPWKDLPEMVPGMKNDEVIKLAADNGVIGTGRTAEVLNEAAEAVAKESSLAVGASKVLPWVQERGKNFLAMREDVNRLSGFASRLRAGDDAMQASLRVEEALFNQARISPAADFLRKTGIAPFISWQAKNIPMQVEWAVRKPGQFAAMLRGLTLLNGEDQEKIPEALLPQYMKDKYNLVLNKAKDPETGKLVYQYVTDSGVLPMTDLQQLWDSHGRSLLDVLGPLYKLGIDAYEGEFGEEGKKGAGDVVREVFGKPADVIAKFTKAGSVDPRTQLRNPSVMGEVVQQFLPARVQQIAIEDKLQSAQAQNKLDLAKAKGALKKAMVSHEEAKLFPTYAPEDLTLHEQKVQQAQVNYQRVQRQVAAEQQQFDRLRGRIERLNLAP